jgi:hypothetical protein
MFSARNSGGLEDSEEPNDNEGYGAQFQDIAGRDEEFIEMTGRRAATASRTSRSNSNKEVRGAGFCPLLRVQ